MEHTLARLELHFVGESEPLLAKICLFHSALSSSPIIRLSFPTSAGVRAVCLLFLTSVEQQLLGLPDEAFPVKVHRYLAPVWAACKKRKVKWPDKFLGLDSGIPILHRLLKARGKSKSAKQRFDSRAVKLNTEFIPRKGIELFWQSNRVDQIEGVQELLKKFQEAIIKPDSRPILKSANRLEVAQPLKTLRRWESDELKLVKVDFPTNGGRSTRTG